MTARTEAVAAVAAIIGAHQGISALRFGTSGSMSGQTALRVSTVAVGPAKHVKGTKEQQLSMRGSGEDWLGLFQALAPDVPLATGCSEHYGFDVDSSGVLSNVHRPRAHQR